jgi:hypothetical protein
MSGPAQLWYEMIMWKALFLLTMILAGCQSMDGRRAGPDLRSDSTAQLAARGGGDPYLAWQRGH